MREPPDSDLLSPLPELLCSLFFLRLSFQLKTRPKLLKITVPEETGCHLKHDPGINITCPWFSNNMNMF